MQKNLIVVDDFYTDPQDVREYALNLEFNQTGNYPGKRTVPATNKGTLDAIESILGYKTQDWLTHLSGSFQLCSANQRSWIHSDAYNDYAALVFLTPDAPLGSGTSFYRHKDTGTFGCSKDEEHSIPGHHFSETHSWDLVDRVGNKFNRLIIFKGDLWHISDPYFGENKEDSRLFQLFFWNV